jgi:hypothetical protein
MTTAGTLLQHASHAQIGNTYCDAARGVQVMSEGSGVEAISFWGAQAASLLVSAASGNKF